MQNDQWKIEADQLPTKSPFELKENLYWMQISGGRIPVAS